MNKLVCLLVVSSLIAVTIGCTPAKTSARGFRLPDGDAKAGQAAYVAFSCNECHSIKDLELPGDAPEESVKVWLGGEYTRVYTYGELVTSVINPSHRIALGYPRSTLTDEAGDSLMRNNNQVMSVQELIDIVAFLQPLYSVVIPEYEYPHYAYH